MAFSGGGRRSELAAHPNDLITSTSSWKGVPMTNVTLSGPASACKAAHIVPAFFPIKTTAIKTATAQRLSSVAPRVSPDEIAAVVATLANFGDRLTLGDFASVMCESRNPNAMMRAIADAGYLSLDVGVFGDAHLSMRRARR